MREGFDSHEPRASAEIEETLNAKTRKVLESIHTDEIVDIFKGEQQRAGIEPTEFDAATILVRDKIQGDTLVRQPRGAWVGAENRIELNPEKIDKHARLEAAQGMNVSFESNLVSTYVHEISHAMSHNLHAEVGIMEYLGALSTSPLRIDEIGYHTVDLKSFKHHEKYRLFNEGVTDYLSENVFDEYRKRTADSHVKDKEYSPGYIPQRALLEAFLVHVGDVTGTGRDTVWKAVKQGYFSGVDLDSNELGELYNEFALAEIMDRIKKLGGEYDKAVVPLIKELYTRSVFAPMTEDSRKRIVSGLELMQR